MREIKTIEVDKYSAPNEKGLVRHIGMASPREIFEVLEQHLKANDLMPDEYFLPGNWEYNDVSEVPLYQTAICNVNWGGSEGIYLNIALLYYENGESKFFDLATGKTLSEDGDAYLRMSRIAAECSMMLNGRGDKVRFHENEKNSDLSKMLDALVSDENPSVRVSVARQGYGLDILVHDNDPQVRCAVAERGYALDELAKDDSWLVRRAVAKQGFALNYFVNDEDARVRSVVVFQGYGLDKLVNDGNDDIRWMVGLYLKTKPIEEWITENRDKCVLPENCVTETKNSSLDEKIASAAKHNIGIPVDVRKNLYPSLDSR